MPVDTQAKRNSAIATRRLPWLRRFAPAADGTVDQADRQQTGLVYNGILSSTSILPGAARNSAIATRRLPWFRRFQPLADGSMTQADRQQTAFVYRDILAQSVPPAPEPDDVQILPGPGLMDFVTPGGGGRPYREPLPLEEKDIRGQRTGAGQLALSGQSQAILSRSLSSRVGLRLSGQSTIHSVVNRTVSSRILIRGQSKATGIDWIRVQIEDYVLMGIN